MALVAILLATFVFTWPSPLLAGTETVALLDPPIKVTICLWHDASAKASVYPLVYTIVLFILFMTLVAVLTVAYGRIGLAIRKHNRNMRRARGNDTAMKNQETARSRCGEDLESESCAEDDEEKVESNSSCDQNPGQFESNRCEQGLSESTATSRTTAITVEAAATSSASTTSAATAASTTSATAATTSAISVTVAAKTATSAAAATSTPSKIVSAVRMYRTTVIAVLVTLVFFLSYVPYFALAANFNAGFEQKLRGAKLVTYSIFLRFPFFNAVTNPFIYNALNPAFKAQCSRMASRVFCRLRNKSSDGDKDEENSTTCTAAGTRTVSSNAS
jgi:hypothetical protein